MFSAFVSFPRKGLFILINKKEKKVYISYSSNIHAKIGLIVDQMLSYTWRWKEMTKDRKNLELQILETSTERHFVKYYKEWFKSQGYTIYNELEKNPLSYVFRIEYTQRKVLVVAVTARNDKTVLGRFETYDEARGFLFYIQHNNPANSLCFSTNGIKK